MSISTCKFIFIINIIFNNIRKFFTNYKESYMESIEAMAHKGKYMGVGVLGVTQNAVDLVFCAAMGIIVVGYVLYLHLCKRHMDRCDRRMGWSPLRDDLHYMARTHKCDTHGTHESYTPWHIEQED